MKKWFHSVWVLGSLLTAGVFYGLREEPLSVEEHVAAPVKTTESFQTLEEPTHRHSVPAGVSALREEEPLVPLQLSTIPESRLREQLLRLPANLQDEALHYLAERPTLLNDLASLRIGPSGQFYYVCVLGADKAIPEHDIGPPPRVSAAAEALGASVSISAPPVRHSRPGSNKILFLDFNGHVVSGTIWNTDADYGRVASWDCRPYDTDGNEATFSASEQAHIIEIWERVAEDYAPFDVDVTTEEPANWTSTTGHALITPNVDKNGVQCPHYGAGGLAYVDKFGKSNYDFYSPAWVLDYGYYKAPSIIAEAASHELGHNLNLYHDGTTSLEYYSGHTGGAAPSWGPIMGTGYGQDISQWSKGEYYQYDNEHAPENDLAILSSTLNYRTDDAGDNNVTATELTLLEGETIAQAGVIERTDNPDVYHFTTLAGEITITAEPYQSISGTWGGNLDIELRLYNEAGVLQESDNPSDLASASIVRVVTAGKYFLHVIPVGAGTPTASTPTGYTSYGSLGQYFMSGSVLSDGDSDGDNLPNFWEKLYFNSSELYGALDDPDNDGSDNYSEFIAGTLPNNPASVFAITNYSNALPSDAPNILNWSTVEGHIYSVGYTPNLQYTAFAVFPDANNLPHTVNSYTDTVNHAESKGFYRVEVQFAP